MRTIMRYLGIKGTQPRASPSQANPSILLGERVDTEDDILHMRNLPDFDGTLGAKDAELLLQYLLTPYMRIPLLLNFFSQETRLKALRSKELQEVLDAALFEPGAWQETVMKEVPTMVPADNRDNLNTVVGLLFNEIIMSPHIVLNSIKQMLERVIDLDTGRYSELGSCVLYVMRLAVRIESYIHFLVESNRYQNDPGNNHKVNGAFEHAYVRGLQCDQAALAEAEQYQRQEFPR